MTEEKTFKCECEKVDSHVCELYSTMAWLSNELRKMVTEANIHRQRFEDVKEKLQQYKQDAENWKRKAEESRDYCDELKEHSDANDEILQVCRHENTDLKEANERLEIAVSQWKSDCDYQISKKAALKTEIEELQEQHKRVVVDRDFYKARVDSLTYYKQKVQSKARELQQALDLLNDEVWTLRVDVENLRKERTTWQDRYNDLTAKGYSNSLLHKGKIDCIVNLCYNNEARLTARRVMLRNALTRIDYDLFMKFYTKLQGMLMKEIEALVEKDLELLTGEEEIKKEG